MKLIQNTECSLVLREAKTSHQSLLSFTVTFKIDYKVVLLVFKTLNGPVGAPSGASSPKFMDAHCQVNNTNNWAS